MATVNAQSVEDFADRIVYRFPGGRYTQAETNWNGAFTTGLKTLFNTDTTREYSIPASGIPAKFFKVDLYIYTSVQVTESGNIGGLMLLKCGFLRVSIPSLNYDGRSMQTEFYQEKNENYIPSAQMRFINIANITLEPVLDVAAMQYTGLSGITFTNPGTGTNLTAIIQPVVTMYKK